MTSIIDVLENHRIDSGYIALLRTARALNDKVVKQSTGGFAGNPNRRCMSRQDLELEVGPNVVNLLWLELLRRGYCNSEHGGLVREVSSYHYTLLSAMENEWAHLL